MAAEQNNEDAPFPNGDDTESAAEPAPAWYEGIYRPDLFEMAEDSRTENDFNDLRARLLDEGELNLDLLRPEDYYYVEIHSTLVHALLWNSPKVPLDLVKLIVEKGGTDLLKKRSIAGNRPLHLVAMILPKRTEIAAFLLQYFPEAVRCRNNKYERPIDILSNKIIMMEERKKYGWEVDLQPIWETIHLVAGASCPDIDFQQPLVHSCIGSPDFPVALLQRAIQQHPEQLKEANEHGDLPLHLMLGRHGNDNNEEDEHGNDSDEEDEDDEDMQVKLLTLVLEGNMSAAVALNNGLSREYTRNCLSDPS